MRYPLIFGIPCLLTPKDPKASTRNPGTRPSTTGMVVLMHSPSTCEGL